MKEKAVIIYLSYKIICMEYLNLSIINYLQILENFSHVVS